MSNTENESIVAINDTKLRILIVSNTPWDDSNSFGSSFSNIFGGNEHYSIANIYCQQGLPNTQVCSRFFQISERSILQSLRLKKHSSGREVFNVPNVVNRDTVMLKNVTHIRWQIMLWLRDLIWMTGGWKSEALDRFIDDFDPDLIFQPVYFQPHMDRIGLYVRRRTGVPMVGYISDDNYTLRQFSLSPLFWIDRLIKRNYVKRTIDACRILYTITEKQRDEYNRLFGDKCKVLYKGGNFDAKVPNYEPNNPVQLVYTGNLGAGRWETLAEIAACLTRINARGKQVRLSIYSQTDLPANALARLNIPHVSAFRGSIPASEVKNIQRSADILIHVESFQRSERYKARLSFSTKIVDYMESGRCILAVGWAETGGIEYLKQYDAAMIVTDKRQLEMSLECIIADHSLRGRYIANAYQCGIANHRYDRIRNDLYQDIYRIAVSGKQNKSNQ